MSDEDIADRMIAAWNDPFATESDPRLLLIEGAKTIRALRREVAASRSVIQTFHEINEEMAREIRSLRPDPNAPLYFLGILLAVVCGFAIWMFLVN